MAANLLWIDRQVKQNQLLPKRWSGKLGAARELCIHTLGTRPGKLM